MVQELRPTREPFILSFDVSVNTIITLVDNAHNQLFIITKYRAKMREYYSTSLSKYKIKELNISKHTPFFSLTLGPTYLLIHAKDSFALIGAHMIHGNKNGWFDGLWFSENLLVTTWRFCYIFFRNYMRSLCWLCTSTTGLTLVIFRGLVLDIPNIDPLLRVNY